MNQKKDVFLILEDRYIKRNVYFLTYDNNDDDIQTRVVPDDIIDDIYVKTVAVNVVCPSYWWKKLTGDDDGYKDNDYSENISS